jgi:hypothetical protein
MIDKLILLSGDSSLSQIDPRDLDDESAGLWLLFQISRAVPGITWGQLLEASNPRLSGWLSDAASWVGHGTSDFVSKAGSVVKDTLSVTGDFVGAGVRLVTDEQVIKGTSQIAAAVGTGGLSLAIPSGISDIFGGVDTSQIGNFLAQLGIGTKQNYQNLAPGAAAPSRLPLYIAGGAAGLVVLLLLTRRS